MSVTIDEHAITGHDDDLVIVVTDEEFQHDAQRVRRRRLHGRTMTHPAYSSTSSPPSPPFCSRRGGKHGPPPWPTDDEPLTLSGRTKHAFYCIFRTKSGLTVRMGEVSEREVLDGTPGGGGEMFAFIRGSTRRSPGPEPP